MLLKKCQTAKCVHEAQDLNLTREGVRTSFHIENNYSKIIKFADGLEPLESRPGELRWIVLTLHQHYGHGQDDVKTPPDSTVADSSLQTPTRCRLVWANPTVHDLTGKDLDAQLCAIKLVRDMLRKLHHDTQQPEPKTLEEHAQKEMRETFNDAILVPWPVTNMIVQTVWVVRGVSFVWITWVVRVRCVCFACVCLCILLCACVHSACAVCCSWKVKCRRLRFMTPRV